MLYRLVIPTKFEDGEEARALEWHKEPGDRLEPGMLILEVETHKAVLEIRADQPGYLRERRVEEGEWRRLGATLAVLSDDAEEAIPAQDEDLAIVSARFSIG